MTLRYLLSLFLLVGLTACAPSGGQPRFDTRPLPSATAIPMSPNPRVVATLASRIASFDVSPDVSVLAVATSQGVNLYDLHSYKFLRTINDGEFESRVAWSPDGRKLAVGGTKDYGTPFFVGGDSSNSAKAHLTVWDASTWKVVFEPAFGNEMVNQMFRDLAWSPDGRDLAFSLDIGGVRVMDAQTGNYISQQGDFAATVTGISWSPDGTRLVASSDMAYSVRRWRLSDDQSVRLFDPRASASEAVAWSPDGKRIASGHYLGGVCLWTADTNRCDGFIQAHRERTASLVWSPDGNQLATGGGVIRIWDTHNGKLVRAMGEETNYLYDLIEWPAPGTQLLSLQISFDAPNDTVLRLWDVASGAILAEWRGG